VAVGLGDRVSVGVEEAGTAGAVGLATVGAHAAESSSTPKMIQVSMTRFILEFQ